MIDGEAPAAGAEVPAETADTSLSDALSAAFDRMQEPEAPAQPAAPVRGSDGRFQGKTETPAEAPIAATGEQNTDQPKAAEGETAEPSIPVPQSWSAEAKATWDKVPPEARKFIAEREAEAHRQITQQGEQIARYSAIEQVMGPRRAALAATYGTDAQALQTLFSISDFATAKPAEFIPWFAAQHGIDLGQLAQQAQASQTQADPEIQALKSEVHGLKTHLTKAEQAAQAQAQQQTVALVQRFSDAKGQDGKPLRPHFGEVVADIMAMIPRLQSEGLSGEKLLAEAYDRAVYANPTTRAKVAAAEETKKAAERQKAADEAKRKGAINVRTQGASGGNGTAHSSLKEAQEAAWARATGG